MDVLAFTLSIFISYWFTFCIVAYIAASRAYSYRGIRLKKYPVAGYLTSNTYFQGAVTYFMVYHGSSINKTLAVPPAGMVAASLLIGGFYPLTPDIPARSRQTGRRYYYKRIIRLQGHFYFLPQSYIHWP